MWKLAAFLALLAVGCATAGSRHRCPPPARARAYDDIDVRVIADARLCAVRLEQGVGVVAVAHDGTVHAQSSPVEPAPAWIDVFDESAFGGEQAPERVLPLPRGGWMTTNVGSDPLRLYYERRDASGRWMEGGFIPGHSGGIAVNEAGSWVADVGGDFDERSWDTVRRGYVQLFDKAGGRGWKRGYTGSVEDVAISPTGNVAFVNEQNFAPWVVFMGPDGHERWRRRVGDSRQTSVSLAFSNSERVVVGLRADRSVLRARRRVGPVDLPRSPHDGVVVAFSSKGVALWSRRTSGVPTVVAGRTGQVWAVAVADRSARGSRRRRHAGGVTFTELSRGRVVWRGSVVPEEYGLRAGFWGLRSGAEGTVVAMVRFGEAPHPHGGDDPRGSSFHVYIPPR